MAPAPSSATSRLVSRLFSRLPYRILGKIYCHEGGDAFWKAKRGPCERLGLRLARVLGRRLRSGGRSLYVGAGVPELPLLAMETLDRGRRVVACNLRSDEVRVLNRACAGLPFRFAHRDAGTVTGSFDHLWIVSVLNDPESSPELAALSYGTANPITFDPRRFERERRRVARLLDRCLRNLTLPGLVTTSNEEAHWIADWCEARRIPWRLETRRYPSPTVGDPICFIRVGERKERRAGGDGHRTERL